MRPRATMSKFVIEFGKQGTPAVTADGRLDAPAFHRNAEPIWDAIGGFLSAARGDVLEIGSGTGQHIMTYAARTPNLTWWPSDIYEAHLTSIAAWRAAAGLGNVQAPQRIDLTAADWTWTPGGKLTAMLCFNVLHISPWRVAESLMAGAGRFLDANGRLFIYGPFKRDGRHTAPSNEAFDRSLRAQNPEWGVRDLGDVNASARDAGLAPTDIIDMPANNLVLVFSPAARQT